MYTVGSPAGCVVEHMLPWPNMAHILLSKFWHAFRDMAPCRVYIRNLLFSVTYQVLAAFLRDAGLAFERIDIKRTGMRFGQARYCYAFVSVATEEIQRRLISRLHGQTCEALSDKRIFAEAAIPRMNAWMQQSQLAEGRPHQDGAAAVGGSCLETDVYYARELESKVEVDPNPCEENVAKDGGQNVEPTQNQAGRVLDVCKAPWACPSQSYDPGRRPETPK